MARPRSANPKTEYIGTKTTKELKMRFNRVCERKGLRGDDWLILFLGFTENDADDVKSQKNFHIMRIKEIDREIRMLENERISCENIIEELNEIQDKNGDSDVKKAIRNIIQRYNNQSVYNISEFLKFNESLVKNQAYLCGISSDELEKMIVDMFH